MAFAARSCGEAAISRRVTWLAMIGSSGDDERDRCRRAIGAAFVSSATTMWSELMPIRRVLQHFGGHGARALQRTCSNNDPIGPLPVGALPRVGTPRRTRCGRLQLVATCTCVARPRRCCRCGRCRPDGDYLPRQVRDGCAAQSQPRSFVISRAGLLRWRRPTPDPPASPWG